ncbi:hypothetical protein HUT19_41630 (plasmid) [Streptomyces sp. NA02950]|uniref:hypothetical protein n=1 Tax=Streptomyces sp. NA02950 TaxID=2742137 RepID=UPI001590D071|nr:hypothetical protein [Streptomyces sp. NA02950]QKV98224.1 hypothetical protein HUT19_41630 [Streptomyces sp. NA02950]
MTPSALLMLWLANWLVMSAVTVFFVKNRPAGSASSSPDLWGLEHNLPGLVALLLVAWPVALFRIVPAVFPLPPRRTDASSRR